MVYFFNNFTKSWFSHSYFFKPKQNNWIYLEKGFKDFAKNLFLPTFVRNNTIYLGASLPENLSSTSTKCSSKNFTVTGFSAVVYYDYKKKSRSLISQLN